MFQILLIFFPLIIQQANTEWVNFGDEVANVPSSYDYFMAKRHLGALAKNKDFPERRYSSPKRAIPPMVTAYGGIFNEAKRYLGALARNGDLNYSTPQRKKTMEGTYESSVNQEADTDAVSPIVMKIELMENLKPILLQYINEEYKHYDPRKVDLFLKNLANAVFDRNEEFTLENIKSLVATGYFQREDANGVDKTDPKRNIQTMVRDSNVSFSGVHVPESQQDESVSTFYYPTLATAMKKNLESIMRAKSFYKRYIGAMATNRDFPKHGEYSADEHPHEFEIINKNEISRIPHMQHRLFNEDYPLPNSINYEQELNDVFENTADKRHTMYDINEPAYDMESAPLILSAADPSDYNDYADQMSQDAAIPIGKRYLGALARSGWLPKGFTLRSSRVPEYEKRHIGALARLGWLAPTRDSNGYYTRGERDFRAPPLVSARVHGGFRAPMIASPRTLFLKSTPDVGRCQCKRSQLASWPSRNWRQNIFGPNAATKSIQAHFYSPPPALIAPQPAMIPPFQVFVPPPPILMHPFMMRPYPALFHPPSEIINRAPLSYLDKRYLLLPAVDKFLLQHLHPHLLREQYLKRI